MIQAANHSLDYPLLHGPMIRDFINAYAGATGAMVPLLWLVAPMGQVRDVQLEYESSIGGASMTLDVQGAFAFFGVKIKLRNAKIAIL